MERRVGRTFLWFLLLGYFGPHPGSYRCVVYGCFSSVPVGGSGDEPVRKTAFQAQWLFLGNFVPRCSESEEVHDIPGGISWSSLGVGLSFGTPVTVRDWSVIINLQSMDRCFGLEGSPVTGFGG